VIDGFIKNQLLIVLTCNLPFASWLRANPSVGKEIYVAVGLLEAYRATACVDSVHQDSVASIQASSGLRVAEQWVSCVQTCGQISVCKGLVFVGNAICGQVETKRSTELHEQSVA
jgi:hypothetical protein